MSREKPTKRGRSENRKNLPWPRGIKPGEHPAEFVGRIYSPEFFKTLAKLLRCKPFDTKKVNAIRHMTIAYIIQANEEKPDPRKLRREYQRLNRVSEQFIASIEAARQRDFARDVYDTARLLGQPAPHAHFRNLPEQENGPGEIYIRDLLSRTELVKAAAKRGADSLSGQAGRKTNLPLSVLVTKAAIFFKMDLKVPFSIDHNKIAKPTKAFDFVRSIVEPLDGISDQEIVTAIRKELAILRDMEKRERGLAANATDKTEARR
jgi:hypothetical protein